MTPKTRANAGTRFWSDETMQFLLDLELNNDRDWFAANKPRYEALVREPALEFIRQMAPRMKRISPHFVCSDRKSGGSLMRVYRDTRFSRDKRPYKTNIGIQFRHAVGRDVHAPGLYLHVGLESCFLGVGCWRPDSASLAGIRRRIVERPAEWKRVRDGRRFREHFELGGDALKRMPRGFDKESPHADDLRRKDHVATAALGHDTALGTGLVDHCAERFAASKPYLRFLTLAVGATF